MSSTHERHSAFANGVSRFLDSADLADFTIVCGSTNWKVHRLVLSVQSSVLANSCNGAFLESETRKIDLSEHEVSHVKAVIDYLYNFDYEAKDDTNHPDKLCFHTDMCILADKYDMPGLATLSLEKFIPLISGTVSQSVIAVTASAAYEVPSVTTEMRKSIVSAVLKGGHLLPSQDTHCEELDDAMRKYPDFAIEVAKAIAAALPINSFRHPKNAAARTFKCTKCADTFVWYLPPARDMQYDCPGCRGIFTGQHWRASAVDLPA